MISRRGFLGLSAAFVALPCLEGSDRSSKYLRSLQDANNALAAKVQLDMVSLNRFMTGTWDCEASMYRNAKFHKWSNYS